MVRPERVRVSMDAPTGDVATVRATVRDLTFQGPVVRLSLAAADDSSILAHIGPEQAVSLRAPILNHDAAILQPYIVHVLESLRHARVEK